MHDVGYIHIVSYSNNSMRREKQNILKENWFISWKDIHRGAGLWMKSNLASIKI